MGHRIIDAGEVFSRLFALGLDTLEIARVFDMREGGVCEELASHTASRDSAAYHQACAQPEATQ